MVFALVVLAGVFAGLALDIFVVLLFVAPLFLAVLLVKAPSGMASAFASAAMLTVVLQLGYMAGLLARQRRTRRNLAAAASSKPVDK